jgi:serine/threonine protein kinase
MIHEALKSHGELSFSPMQPAQTSARAQYLGGGKSFKVVRVPWQQARVDTGGRVLIDVVYKRLNHHDGSREAWLEFLKDLVVTHHMTYHVSAAHKRNIVRLLGLSFEPAAGVTRDVFGIENLAPSPVIALEHAPFGTLADLYYSSAFLSSHQRKLWLLSDVADGLEALHCSNVIHGDVKPENILIFGDKDHGVMAKLADFGLAVIDPAAGPKYQSLPGGTGWYLAPEARAGLMPRDNLKYTDVYSFGIVVWQTLLGGTMPFSLPRYRNGQSLSEEGIERLKAGDDQGLAELFGITVSREGFLRLNQGGEIAMNGDSELPDDTVNALLLAMAQESLEPLVGGESGGTNLSIIPSAEFPIMLSILQIALSSRPSDRRLEPIQLLLGRQYEPRQIPVSMIKWDAKVAQALAAKLDFNIGTGRVRELYVSVSENFFTVLQQSPRRSTLERMGKLDALLARYLASALLEYEISRFLAGNVSDSTCRLILQYLFLASAAGSFASSAASLPIHQLLGAVIQKPSFYAIGAALSILRENATLAWYEQQPSFQQFREQLRKGRIQSTQKDIDPEQTRVFLTVQLDQDVGPINVNAQNDDGDTLLHIAMRSGNTPLAFSLFHDHDADLRVKNKFGEEPIHWLHRLDYVTTMAPLLARAGADIETSATVRFDNDTSSSFPVVERTMTTSSLFSTPLLRAIQSRNVEAVIALVELGAEVGSGPETSYHTFGMCPVGIAAAMMEHECLSILLPFWEPNATQNPDTAETLVLWELAIAGISRIDLVKFHGAEYGARVKKTLEVLTEFLGPCYLVKNRHSSMEYVVEGGDMAWVEAILNTLHSPPSQACLADLQLGLRAAINHGYREIAQKIMSFGALPLLPWKWATSGLTAGRPGVWSSNLILRLQKEMFERGDNMYESECCLHFCANAGADAVGLAADMLASPVVSPCLKPDLSKPVSIRRDRGASADDSLWTNPRLDRQDENGNTPLYYAIVNGEFALARLFLAHGASCHRYDWSLPAQIFEDGQANFASQLEFLLKMCHESFPFAMERRVFDRLYPQSNLPMDAVPDKISWPVERGNILTAMAGICAYLEENERRRLWGAVLPLFADASHLLAKIESSDGQDALQIAIGHADRISARALMETMKIAGVFTAGNYSVIDQARDLLLAEPPSRIFNSPIKKRIISFRLDLGDIILRLLGNGDRGLSGSARADVAERILEVLGNEFAILVVGFKQRGVSGRNEFRRSAEDLCNAMMTTVYHCCQDMLWKSVADKLERGLTDLLSEYFTAEMDSWISKGSRGAKVKLHFIDSNTGSPPPVPAWSLTLQKKPAAIEFLNWQLYRKLRWMETILEKSSESPLPGLSEGELVMLASLGFDEMIPSSNLLTARVLEVRHPLRSVRQEPITNQPYPVYYARRQSPALPDMTGDFQSQLSKKRFVETLRQIDPNTDCRLKEEAISVLMRRLSGFVDDLDDLGPGPSVNSAMRHPLFGRIRTEHGYMDLPLDVYFEGERRLKQSIIDEYARVGFELPDELKQLGLGDSRSKSGEEDEFEASGGATD